METQGKDACELIYNTGKLEEETEKLRGAVEDWKELSPDSVNKLTVSKSYLMANTRDIRLRIKGVKKYKANYPCHANGCHIEDEKGTRCSQER